MAKHSLPDRVGVIYAIVHVASGRRYIGSTRNIGSRFASHRHILRKGTHHSPRLQAAWDEHGAEAFEWVIIEAVFDPETLISREQHWMDHHETSQTGFNLYPNAANARGYKWSDEAKAAISTARKGRRLGPRSAEHRAKLSAAAKSRKYSPETRAAMSAARKGRPLGPPSPEHRAKISAAAKGRKWSEEAKARMSAQRTGTRHSGIALANIQASNSRRNKTPEMRAIAAKSGAASKGRKHTPEARAKMSADRKGKVKTPEHLAAIKAAKERRL